MSNKYSRIDKEQSISKWDKKWQHYYSVAGSIFVCILLAFWSLIEPPNPVSIGLGGSSLTFHIRGFQLLTHSSCLFVQAKKSSHSNGELF